MARYLIPPPELHRAQIEIKRSRFIASIFHTPTAEDAQDFLKRVREEFRDATHNCWAFVCGPPGDTRSIGMSDDGEPHGTAGKPMLNILVHSNIGEITSVVTRYYGGTKLGTGGLARAYSGAVEEALKSMHSIERIPRKSATTSIEYFQLDLFRLMLPKYEINVTEELFSDKIQLQLAIPEEHLDPFTKDFANLTQGHSTLKIEK